MKNFVVLALLVAFLGTAVIGCGGTTTTKPAGPTTPATTPDKKAPS